MITCFVHTESLTEGTLKYIHDILLICFFLIPCCNFIYGIIEAIIIFTTIKNQNDQENKSLFYRYSVYIGTYLLLTFLMFIIYFWDFWTTDIPTKPFRWITYFITMLLVLTPLLVGLFRFLQIFSKHGRFKKCFKRRRVQRRDELSGSLLPDVEFDTFEKKAIKKVIYYINEKYSLYQIFILLFVIV